MIYNVELNSYNRCNTNALDSISTSDFYFDWSVIPEGKYDMTFSFVSSQVNQSTVNSIPVLNVGLGQSCNFSVDPNRISAKTTNNIGVLTPYTIGTVSYIVGDTLLNHPVSINRPTNNLFRVDILTNITAARLLWADTSGLDMDSYILILSLKLHE